MTNSMITLPTKKVKAALDYYKANFNGKCKKVEVDTNAPKVELDVSQQPIEFIEALLLSAKLTKAQTTLVNACVPAFSTALEDAEVSSVNQLYLLLKRLDSGSDLSVMKLCIEVGRRWYPIPFNIERMTNPWTGSTYLRGSVNLVVGDINIQRSWWFESGLFIKDKKETPRKLVDLLKDENLRLIRPGELEDFREKCRRAEEFRSRSKTVHDVVGSVLIRNPWSWMNPLEERSMGTEKKPRRVILEDELELHEDHRYRDHDERFHALPFVRAFSLDLKQYVYVDVSVIREHEFDASARSKLVLPGKIQGILNSVFDVDSDEIFGDMFGGRHGGMIILANGTSGVGKTLTAEVFAEHTKRPLYVLEMGELGTNLSHVEDNLMKIFMRATRWNAILLFDEVDIFFSKRGDDLDRNAIVGVFLRLLDHYDGMLFLTTNRREVIDPAFASRITLALDYPNLDDTARSKIWTSLLTAAGFTLEGDNTAVISHMINGRQIRNLVRLLKITVPDRSTVTADDIVPLFDFTARVG